MKEDKTVSTVKTGGFFSTSTEIIVGGCWTLKVSINYLSYFDQSCLTGNVDSSVSTFVSYLTYSFLSNYPTLSAFSIAFFSSVYTFSFGGSYIVLEFYSVSFDYLWLSYFQIPATISLNFLFLLLDSIQLKYSSSTYRSELLSIDFPTTFFG